MSDKHRLALVLAGLGSLLTQGDEIKRPPEPDFTDINMLPTYGVKRPKTHPRRPKQHKPKRRKKR